MMPFALSIFSLSLAQLVQVLEVLSCLPQLLCESLDLLLQLVGQLLLLDELFVFLAVFLLEVGYLRQQTVAVSRHDTVFFFEGGDFLAEQVDLPLKVYELLVASACTSL